MTPQDRARAYSQIAGHAFTAWMQGTALALLVQWTAEVDA